MTLSELRSLVRLLIDQPKTGIWSDANVNSLINSAYREVINQITARNPKYFTKSGTISTTDSTAFMTVPTDCTIMNKLVDSNGAQVSYSDSSKFQFLYDTTQTGTPEYFDVVGRNVWLCPTPDDVYSYTAYYHYLPSTLTLDSSSPELPPNYHDIVAYGAAVKSRMVKEEPINEYQLLYETKLRGLLHQVMISQTNDPPRVKLMRGDMGND